MTSYLARAFLVLSFAVGGASACAAKDVYWTKRGADEKRFDRASRRCHDDAAEQMADEISRSSGRECHVDSRYGTICGRRRESDDPFYQAQREQRQNRRVTYLYNQCMEEMGWVANTEGKGYR